MLVLTRREGENILIEDGIQIQVLAISEFDQIVRIGIEAPKVAIVQCRDCSGLMVPDTHLGENIAR